MANKKEHEIIIEAMQEIGIITTDIKKRKGETSGHNVYQPIHGITNDVNRDYLTEGDKIRTNEHGEWMLKHLSFSSTPSREQTVEMRRNQIRDHMIRAARPYTGPRLQSVEPEKDTRQLYTVTLEVLKEMTKQIKAHSEEEALEIAEKKLLSLIAKERLAVEDIISPITKVAPTPLTKEIKVDAE
mgnify:FL=1|jgi:hypothetical protein|tara:strand:+ start:1135 stop:1689 length:555 start_codon:yes stop_codon:yes gene_type:complete